MPAFTAGPQNVACMNPFQAGRRAFRHEGPIHNESSSLERAKFKIQRKFSNLQLKEMGHLLCNSIVELQNIG